MTLKAPASAVGFSFYWNLFSFEYPDFVCTSFNYMFFVSMDPPPASVDPQTKNIVAQFNAAPISVNSASEVLLVQEVNGNCQGDEADGFKGSDCTGFEMHGTTGWMATFVPVTPGATFTLMFSVFDAGDGVFDTTALIDGFRWTVE